MTGIWRCKLFAQLRGELKPVHTIGKIVVRQNEVGPDHPSRRPVPALLTPSGAVAMLMALVLEHQFKEFAHIGIVIHDQDRAGPATIRNRCISRDFGGVLKLWCRTTLRGSMTSMAKTEPLPDANGHEPDGQAVPQPLHDGQSKAEAAAPRSRGVVELMILLEDRLEFRLGDADAGVPDLDAQHALAPRQPSSTLPRLVYFNALESRLRIICSSRRGSLRIDEAARDHPQDKSLGLSVIGELIPQPFKQIIDREIRPLRRGRCRPRSG